MEMELIGASLDDFTKDLFFIDDNNKLLMYVSFYTLGVRVQGWGDISWSLYEKNSLSYQSIDHNLYKSKLDITYDAKNDVLMIFLNEERPGYDSIDIVGSYFDFEPGEEVSHFADNMYNINELSKKLYIVDSISKFKEYPNTLKLICKWNEEYNLGLSD